MANKYFQDGQISGSKPFEDDMGSNWLRNTRNCPYRAHFQCPTHVTVQIQGFGDAQGDSESKPADRDYPKPSCQDPGTLETTTTRQSLGPVVRLPKTEVNHHSLQFESQVLKDTCGRMDNWVEE
ncbi:hypothetical protein R3P38DRAFT_2771815 [Favolaschia claudopus]|uniref:Uncharacterized protein n=1 Tax=Favolaschia claudopus TaxID=2862362 RepID=A0AAW0CB17_9AGAR